MEQDYAWLWVKFLESSYQKSIDSDHFLLLFKLKDYKQHTLTPYLCLLA